jgi:hypothetical protein
LDGLKNGLPGLIEGLLSLVDISQTRQVIANMILRVKTKVFRQYLLQFHDNAKQGHSPVFQRVVSYDCPLLLLTPAKEFIFFNLFKSLPGRFPRLVSKRPSPVIVRFQLTLPAVVFVPDFWVCAGGRPIGGGLFGPRTLARHKVLAADILFKNNHLSRRICA